MGMHLSSKGKYKYINMKPSFFTLVQYLSSGVETSKSATTGTAWYVACEQELWSLLKRQGKESKTVFPTFINRAEGLKVDCAI